MNMNKALQDLYYAVSGSTTTKRNITKLLLDLHYAIIGKESENKNNHSRIVESLAQNWPSGGGGSSDFSTAEVTITDDNVSLCVSVIMGDAIWSYLVSEEDCIVPLYKGKAVLMLTAPPNNVACTGDIEYNSSGFFIVTGNGTITIS